jgi:hypothetical protein
MREDTRVCGDCSWLAGITRTLAAVIACALYGAAYGAIAGALYAVLFVAQRLDGGSALLGAILGAECGTVAGAVGGILGGAGGFCIGGLLSATTTLPIPFTGHTPTVIAVAFGLVVGFAIRHGVPVLPGTGWVIEAVYASPLRRWLGWRR